MYRSHWGLRESPFRGSLEPRFFYQSPTHDEALARLNFLVDDSRRVGLLLGEHGGGKSMVLEVFSRQLRRGGSQVANVNMLGADIHDFLWMLAAELGVGPGREENAFSLWRAIDDRLVENRYQQFETVVLLDDADEAPAGVLDQVARLAQSQVQHGSKLTIVLAATAHTVTRLGHRLLELADLRIDLEAWEESDTAGYLTNALAQAGRREPTFDDRAMARLHQLCGGVPRRVNQLANLALLAGAGRQLQQIDAHTVEAVHQELGVIESASA